MDIEIFRKYFADDAVQVTQHALMRCRERNIKFDDIERCIMNGEIIEEYPEDYPYPSVLISCIDKDKALHIIAGLGEKELWIITAYYPDPNKWNNDYKTRKENSI